MPGIVQGGTSWFKSDNPTIIPDNWEIRVIDNSYNYPWPRYIVIGVKIQLDTIEIKSPLVW